jgi:hypothetical protein
MIYRDDFAGNRLFRNIGSSLQATLERRITKNYLNFRYSEKF